MLKIGTKYRFYFIGQTGKESHADGKVLAYDNDGLVKVYEGFGKQIIYNLRFTNFKKAEEIV